MAIILMDLLITLAELINIQRVLSMLAIVHLTIEPTAMTVRIRTTTQRTPMTGDHSREIVLQYLQVTGFLVPWTDLPCLMIVECKREIALPCLTIDERNHEIVLPCLMIEGCNREIALLCRITQECNPETVKRYRITDEHSQEIGLLCRMIEGSSQEIVKYFLFRIDRLN